MTTTTTDKLRVFMAARGLSGSKLAREMGVSMPYVSYILNGKRAITDSFKWKFAAAYGHDAARLVFGDNHDQR